MCIFCNGTGIHKHISGLKECYCVSAKKERDKLPFEPTDRDMIHEEEAFGNDCSGGRCE